MRETDGLTDGATGGSTGGAAGSTGTVVIVVAVLLAVNVIENSIEDSSVLVGPVVAGLLVLIARRRGLSWEALGLSKRHWRRGATYAVIAIAAVSLTFVVAAALPLTRPAFDDARYQTGVGAALVTAFLVIPLGTVLLEEVAFRGVLWAALRQGHGVAAATLWSSILFGLWHVLPSLNLSDSNEAVEGLLGTSWLGQLAAVCGAVAFTTVAGVVLCELRRRSGSLLAPFGLHWATNAVGVLVTAVVWQLSS